MRIPARSVIISALSIATVAAIAQPSSDFRADPLNTGVYRDAVSGPVWPVWEFAASGAVRGSAAVAGGRVMFGSSDGTVYALDEATGRLRWVFHTGGAVTSSPAVSGGSVFVTSRDGLAYAVDLVSGVEKWRASLGSDQPLRFGWDYLMSSPVVTGDAVIVGSASGDVLALDVATGTELWRRRTGGAVRSSPAISEGIVYVGSGDGHLYALDEQTGEVVWKHATEGATLDLEQIGYDRRTIDSSPAVTEDHVVHGSRDGHLYAVRRHDGSRAWRYDHEGSWVIGSPAVADGRVFVGSSDGRFFQALSLDTGEELWRFDAPDRIFSSAAIAGGTVVFGCFDGTVFGLEAETGRLLWRHRAGAPVISSPVLSRGRLFVGTDDGRMVALRGWSGPHPRTLVRRLVYWGGEEVFRLFRNGEALRDSLVARGYTLLDGAGLSALMEGFESDPRPTVVIAADESLPTEILYGGTQSHLRRYLDAGGKLVHLGLPPDALVRDSTGRPIAIDASRGAAILGVEPHRIAGDLPGLEATPVGLDWGHPVWSLGGLAINPSLVTTVLARDEFGRAGSWVLHFGGPPGAGYVQLWGREDPVGDPSWVMAVAEYGLVGGK